MIDDCRTRVTWNRDGSDSKKTRLSRALAAAQPTTSVTQAVFIGSRTPNFQDLIVGVASGEKVFVLDPGQEGLDLIAADLAGGGLPHLSSMSIVGHGSSGETLSGATKLDEADLAGNAIALPTTGVPLKTNDDFSIHCYDVERRTLSAASSALAILRSCSTMSHTPFTVNDPTWRNRALSHGSPEKLW